MTISQVVYITIILFLALQRLLELRLSRHNEAYLRSQGGQEHAAAHFRFMQVLHASWFVAMLAEVVWLARPFIPWLAAVATLLVLVGQMLRYAAIHTLGRRWTVRIFTLPGAEVVDAGIYRYIRHPNYVGVILEIAAVPLLHTAYLTSIIYSLANAALLTVRIQAEEQALNHDNDYAAKFQTRSRFTPRLW